MKKIIIALLICLSMTGIASAQSRSFFNFSPQSSQSIRGGFGGGSGNVRDLQSLVTFIIRYINVGISLIIAFATIMFVYNIVKYFIVKTEEKRSEASQYLLYSIIGLAVIISFWGLVNVVTNTFGLNNSRPPIEQLYFR